MDTNSEGQDRPLPYWLKFLLFLKVYWKTFVLIFIPIAFSPIVIINRTPDYGLLYLLIVMAFYWTFAILPLAVTSMIPLVLYPVMNIMDSDKTVAAYTKEVVLMFICGIIVALGIQNSQLPKRLALWFIRKMGFSHYKLVYSLSFVTMFLSMWVSNSAATSMMLPIMMAVLEVLEENGIAAYHDNTTNSMEERPIPTDVTICYCLMVAYSSSIGGMGTLVGTPTNMIFKGILEARFHEAPIIHFATFMLYTTPLMILIHTSVFLCMIIVYLGWLRPNSKEAKNSYLDKSAHVMMEIMIDNQYTALGPMTFLEKSGAVVFILIVTLFFTRNPGFVTGWGELFAEQHYIRDSVSAVFVIVVIFLLPSSTECCTFFNFKKGRKDFPTQTTTGMLTWDLINRKIYWELIFLIGAGSAIAKGSLECGSSKLIAKWISALESLHPNVIIIILVWIVSVLTEVTSNMAIANIALPIIADVAVSIRVNPIKLMLPVVLACSFPFQTPIGTAPNAMVMAYANIPPKKMMIAGIGPSIFSAVFLILHSIFYSQLVYPELDNFPKWAEEKPIYN